MKTFLVAGAFACLQFGITGPPVGAQTVQSCRADLRGMALEECLVALNASLFTVIMIHGDREALEKHAVPGALLVVADRLEKLGESEGSMGLPKADTLEVQNEEVSVNGDAAALAGELRLQGSMSGRPLPPKIRYLSVFVKTGETWKLLARSLVPVPPSR